MKGKKYALNIIWYFLEKYKVYYMFLMLLAVISGLLEALNVSLVYPILSYGMDPGTQPSSNPFLEFIDPFTKIVPISDSLMRYCVIFVILAALVFVFKTAFYYFSAKFSSMVVIDAKKNVFDKYIDADYQFFVDNRQGEIIYKVFNAPKSISGILDIISNVFIEMFLAVSVFTVLLSMSWKFVLLVLIGGIGYYYLTKKLSIVISYKAGRKKLKSGQREQVILNEYTSGVKQIKVFETFEYWKDMLEKALNTFWFYNRKAIFWRKLPEALIWMILYISIGTAVIVIKLQYPGDFTQILPLLGTFAFGVFMILPKISKFGMYRMKFMHLLPEMEIVHELLEDKNYNKIENGAKKFIKLKSGIKLKDITFKHKERDVLLENLSLDIKKDRITALVGPSGSGKSTIVDLLLRLYDVNEGGVYIDKTNIKELDIYSFREKIGFVSQDTFIYNATVKENISFGNEYSDKEIINAAKFANADEFIRNLPEGYDTIVGDRGVRISGGEKQRIAIARAMIRKPEILILDEATSSLDNVSEKVVQDAIDKVSKNCTTFIIAHRLSTIKKADIIYVLDKGKIVESGTHNELLKKNGEYYKLYKIQRHDN